MKTESFRYCNKASLAAESCQAQAQTEKEIQLRDQAVKASSDAWEWHRSSGGNAIPVIRELARLAMRNQAAIEESRQSRHLSKADMMERNGL